MGFCEFCKKWINQPKGKKKKRFCNSACRSNQWYADNIKGKVVRVESPQNDSNAQKSPPTQIQDEPLSFAKLRQEITPAAATVDFYQLINNAESLEELNHVGLRIKRSALSWKEKQAVEQYGQMVARKKFID